VVAVLAPVMKKGRRGHCGPQRTRTPGLCGFFPANQHFCGKGAMIRFMDRIFAPKELDPRTLSKISDRFAGIYSSRRGRHGSEKGRLSSSPSSTLSAKA